MFRLQHHDGKELDPGNAEQQNKLEEYRDQFDPSKIQVIEHNNQPVGRLRVVSQETIYIGGIQLLPEYRGQGIGTTVLTSLIEQSEQEHKKITLEVHHANTGAYNLYSNLGFIETNSNEKQKIMEYIPVSYRDKD